MEKEVRKQKSMPVSKARKDMSELLGYVLETVEFALTGSQRIKEKKKIGLMQYHRGL